MHLDTIRTRKNGRQYVCHLLRETYRDHGKVKHRTIANLSHCPPEEIQAIHLALQHKGKLHELASLPECLETQQGLSVGAVLVLQSVAQGLGIVAALGSTQEGKRGMWQVLARVIGQGSRLSAVRLAGVHAACEVLGLEPFDEDDLYANLDWLAAHQAAIEDRLFRKRHPDGQAQLFLYDVTSSYLEGTQNELAAFGYCREGKRGKLQIVIGLLCDEEGWPVSVEVFAGNTADTKTFGSQVRKTAERFGGGPVTLVGDRGMIRGPQIALLQQQDRQFHYITAITKPEIESRLAGGLFQMELFDELLAEVIDAEEQVRYVLRRNPLRAEEVAATRRDKRRSVEELVQKQNVYLAEHPRAGVARAVRKVQQKIQRLRVSAWLAVAVSGRTLSLAEDAEALAEQSKLDGCYCLKTDLPRELASKERVEERYRSLSQVEWAFRTCKTAHLEARPIYVRKESRTRGHVFVVMLAYMLVAELARDWQALDLTVEEGIRELSTLCMTEVIIAGNARIKEVPTPRASIQGLLQAAGVRLPKVLPYPGGSVSSKKKLPEERKPL